ncbi:MAG: nodulation protein NfeD [Gemmatimonadota bacterium]|nr:nodulation protein NfeD [Gemmatimonadota bacterium]MDP6802338.1 nodulation protein NfeD [Gemmatimonadota bacterium]
MKQSWWQVAGLAAAAVVLLAASGGASEQPLVHLLRWDDAITPVTADVVAKALDEAHAAGAEAFVLELDTPGGLLDATRDIVTEILHSEVPVLVWVGPAGARAASAGAFITLAGHVAAMAPGTNIGAASPVMMGGGDSPDSTMGSKIQNDAAAFIRTIAQRRGRSVEWAESTVREAVSSTSEEALDAGAIDLIADSVEELLAEADGCIVATPSGEVTLLLTDARIARQEVDLRFRILALLANPNVAYFLLILGFYGLFFELSNPGVILPGVVGAVFLVLALFSMQTLPISAAGLLLLLLGGVFLLLEVKVASHGMLTVAGLASSVLGGLMLFDSPEPALRASLRVILPLTLFIAGLFAVAVSLSVRAMRRKPVTGREGLVGLTGTAATRLAPKGKVSVRGELWDAHASEVMERGTAVQVESVEGLLLRVRSTAPEGENSPVSTDLNQTGR